MTFDQRIQAVANFGFTERQARFLVTVMLSGGVCVPRQYAEFIETAYGHNVNGFFDKLVDQGFAVKCVCIHNRARVYQLRYQPLYQAIGEPNSPNRKPIAAADVVHRLMVLDAVVAQRHLVWLFTVSDKLAFFTAASSCAAELIPRKSVGGGANRRVRLFPEGSPIGVEDNGRPVFVFVVRSWSEEDLRAFVQRHADLLGSVPGWALRFVLSPDLARLRASVETAVRDELASPISAMALAELRWYFEQRRDLRSARDGVDPDRFRRAQRAFGSKRWRVLFRRWLSDGDAALKAASSSSLRDALARGDGKVECEVVRHSYRHLSPVTSLVRARVEGVEKGERALGSPQPLSQERAASFAAS